MPVSRHFLLPVLTSTGRATREVCSHGDPQHPTSEPEVPLPRAPVMGPRAHRVRSRGRRRESDHVVLRTLTLGQLTPAWVAPEKKARSRENQSASLHQLIFSCVM